MKKLLTVLLVLSLFAGFSSCEKPQPVEDDKTEQNGEGEGEGEGENEGENGEGQPEIDMGVFEDPSNPRVPIGWSDVKAEGSEVGVTIEIKKLEPQNFIFELRPGALVQSFRLDVYPLPHLYNYLLNDGMYDKTQHEIQDQIRSYIFNTEGSGGFTFSIDDFENPEDFLQMQFDWMSTSYARATAIVIPDCSFIIAVVACSDKEGNAQEDITLCHVHTPSLPLVGDPRCEIEVNTGYQAFVVNHVLNNDAAGVYYFGGLASEIDAYIDLYGDVMMRDFVRTRLTSPVSRDNADALHYRYDYGEYADPSIQSATIAVCCDANLTPQKGYSRRDFHLKEVPEDVEEAVTSVTVVEDRVAAAYFEFDAVMSKDCNTIFYGFYTEAEKEALTEPTDLLRAAINLKNKGGFGVNNPNFVWDAENECATGSSATVRIPNWGLSYSTSQARINPGDKLYVGYTSRNGVGNLTPLEFSELVTLDQRNLTSPDQCKVKDLSLKLSNATRNSWRIDVTYDPSTVSMVYWQYYTPTANPGLDKNSTWADWTNYIFGGTAVMNEWWTMEGGKDGFAWTGMQPDTEYTVYLCAEDFDGNVSVMHFDTISTLPVQVGPDPTVEMKLVPFNDYNYLGKYCDWQVTMNIVKDVQYLKYTHFMDATDMQSELPNLTQAGLRDIANSGISYQEWYDGLYTLTIGKDGEGGGLEADGDADVTWAGDQVVIVTCVAVGQNDDGTPAYNFFHLICQDGKATTLEEIFNVNE